MAPDDGQCAEHLALALTTASFCWRIFALIRWLARQGEVDAGAAKALQRIRKGADTALRRAKRSLAHYLLLSASAVVFTNPPRNALASRLGVNCATWARKHYNGFGKERIGRCAGPSEALRIIRCFLNPL